MRRRTSTTATEPRVTAEELADELGWSTGAIITKLASLRIAVGPDWADRPSLSVADAARAFERIGGDTRAHDDTWKQYGAYLAEREERRTRAANQAAAQAREGIAGSPEQQHRGQRAAAEARERFDADEPVISFSDWPPGGDE